jgi:UDPglucose 6-dehydrogenase
MHTNFHHIFGDDMNISIIGGGYVGLVTGACFADLGHSVAIINRDKKKAEKINACESPIFEIGLDDLLKKYVGTRLHATTRYDDINRSDLSFICVGTPSTDDGSADLSMLKNAAQSIGDALRGGDSSHVVVVKSTVPPGTTEHMVIPIVLEQSCRDDIGFAMNPEFLREGRAIEDFMHPDRVVIGTRDTRSGRVVSTAYEGLHAPLYFTGITAAEMVKYTSNALLATKISFSNEIGNICKKMGIDVYEVMKGVGMDHRLSSHFLDAGVGFGGSCFPKDVRALIHLAEGLGEKPQLLRSVVDVNERQPFKMISLLERKIGSLDGKRVAVLGLAFKDNTDDIRDSRAIPVIQELVNKHVSIAAYDPVANVAMKEMFPDIMYFSNPTDALRGADACLIMTEWPEFKKLDKEFDVMRSRIIIEGRRILTCTNKEGICW